MLKSYGIALAICLAIGAFMFVGAYHFLGHNLDLAKGIATLPVFATPKLAEVVHQHQRPRRPDQILSEFSFGAFTMQGPVLALATALLTIGLTGGGSLISAMLTLMIVTAAHAQTSSAPQVLAASGLLIIPIYAFGFYSVGRWGGVHGGKYSFPITLLTIAATFALFKAVDYAFMTDEMAAFVHTQFRDASGVALVSAIAGSLICVAAALGYWRGRSVRRLTYVRHLMKMLPPSTRDTFLDLIHQEARALRES